MYQKPLLNDKLFLQPFFYQIYELLIMASALLEQLGLCFRYGHDALFFGS